MACTSADSYVEASACEAGTVAEIVSTCNSRDMPPQFMFNAFAVGVQGPLNESDLDLLCDATSDDHKSLFLCKRVSVVV